MLSQYALANALSTNDEDSKEECREQFEAMITEEIPETAVHPTLMAKARGLVSGRRD